MHDKVLIVTGGSRGIGAATCLLAAERGYAVVVNYAGNVEAAEHVAAQIHKRGGTAVAVRGDVSHRGRRRAHLPRRRPHGEAGGAGQQCRHHRAERAGRGARRERASTASLRSTSPARSSAPGRRSSACRRATAARAAASSTSARPPPSSARPASMSTMLRPRAPSTPSPSGWRSRWRARASASTRCGRASSTPRSTPRAATRTGRRGWRRACRSRVPVPPRKWRGPSSGCSRTRPPTPPAPPSTVTGGRAILP